MRNLIVPSAFAIALAMSTPAFTQEEWDQSIDKEGVIDLQPLIDEAFDEDFSADQDLAAETEAPDEVTEAIDPEIIRQEMTALIKLPVRDVNEKKLGVVENVVMKDGAPYLIIVKLDSLIPGDKLLRAIPGAEAGTWEEGAAVTLATLTRAEVRKQSAFIYEDAMDTIVPVIKPTERSDQQSES